MKWFDPVENSDAHRARHEIYRDSAFPQTDIPAAPSGNCAWSNEQCVAVCVETGVEILHLASHMLRNMPKVENARIPPRHAHPEMEQISRLIARVHRKALMLNKERRLRGVNWHSEIIQDQAFYLALSWNEQETQNLAQNNISEAIQGWVAISPFYSPRSRS